MNHLIASIVVEIKKFVRSRVLVISLLMTLLIPLFSGFFMFILLDPERAKQFGILSSKAELLGNVTANWENYLALLSQAISIGGLFIFGFLFSWMFGREYVDRTIKDLLALPIPRATIVYSKFIVMGLWCMILSIFVHVVGIIGGFMIQLPEFSWKIFITESTIFVLCASLTMILSLPIGFIASMSRSYLASIGFLIGMIFLTQIVVVVGYGQYFPWSIPSLLSGMDGTKIELTVSGLLLVSFPGIIGVIGTVVAWRHQDYR